MNVSVVIITLNEELNLPGCLETLRWCDDIVVFDSRSTDRTAQIARAAGARFIERTFDDYATHRNAALESVSYKHPWVLVVDADERVLPELAREIDQTLQNVPDDVALFRVRRKDMFLGRWIRRSSGYPTWFGRLIRLGQVRFFREVHEDTQTQGRTCFLKQHLIHYPFAKDVSHWLDRHNAYSSIEARIRVRDGDAPFRWSDLFAKDPSDRRRALKQFGYCLPFRPLLVFLFLYVIRLGVLDGRPGFTYCRLRYFYEFMINVKVRELRRRNKGLDV